MAGNGRLARDPRRRLACPGRRGRPVRPDAPARGEPRHPAPGGGRVAPDTGGPIARRSRHDRLAGGARRLEGRCPAVAAGRPAVSALMDLIAGDERSILLAISVDDWAGLDDSSRFDAHLSLGGGLDPTWLDLFAEAVRTVTATDQPTSFLDARRELDGP